MQGEAEQDSKEKGNQESDAEIKINVVQKKGAATEVADFPFLGINHT